MDLGCDKKCRNQVITISCSSKITRFWTELLFDHLKKPSLVQFNILRPFIVIGDLLSSCNGYYWIKSRHARSIGRALHTYFAMNGDHFILWSRSCFCQSPSVALGYKTPVCDSNAAHLQNPALLSRRPRLYIRTLIESEMEWGTSLKKLPNFIRGMVYLGLQLRHICMYVDRIHISNLP